MPKRKWAKPKMPFPSRFVGLYVGLAAFFVVGLVAACFDGISGPELGAEQQAEANLWFEEDFSTYGGVSGDPTRDFREDINGWWGRWIEWDGRSAAPLATIVQDEIPGLGSVQAYEQAHGDGQCKPGHTVGRTLLLPEPAREIWVEIYVKFSDNYRADYKPQCGDQASVGHKLIFFNRRCDNCTSTWRWKVGIFNQEYRLRGTTPEGALPYVTLSHGQLPNACFNGIWQRWRFHLRSASARGVEDGYLEGRRVELDDPDEVYIERCGSGEPARLVGLTPSEYHQGFDSFDLGRTFNLGPTETQSWRWGRIRVWRADPGWQW